MATLGESYYANVTSVTGKKKSLAIIFTSPLIGFGVSNEACGFCLEETEYWMKLNIKWTLVNTFKSAVNRGFHVIRIVQMVNDFLMAGHLQLCTAPQEIQVYSVQNCYIVGNKKGRDRATKGTDLGSDCCKKNQKTLSSIDGCKEDLQRTKE